MKKIMFFLGLFLSFAFLHAQNGVSSFGAVNDNSLDKTELVQKVSKPVNEFLKNVSQEERAKVQQTRSNGIVTVPPPVAPPIRGNRAVILNETFTTPSLPTGWTTLDVDGDGFTWQFHAFNQGGGQIYPEGRTGLYCINSASYYNGTGTLWPDNWLITPPLQLQGISEISWWVKAMDPLYPEDHYGVYISTTGTNPSDFTLLFEETLTEDQAEWTLRTVPYIPQTGTCYFAFRHFDGNDQYIILIDDIMVTTIEGSLCPAVTNLAAATSGNDVTLTWTATGTPIEFEIFRDGISIATVTSPSFTETDVPIGIYDYCVEAIYDDGCVPLPACINVMVGRLCAIKVELIDSYGDGWNGNTLEVIADGTTVATLTVASGYSFIRTFHFPNYVTLQFKYNAIGSYQSENTFKVYDFKNDLLYSSPAMTTGGTGIFFTHEVDCGECDMATNLTVAYNTNCTADLTWTASSDAASYNVYRGAELLANVTTTSYTDNTLNPSQPHIWSVRAVCESGSLTPAVTVSKPSCNGCSPVTNLTVEYVNDCDAQLTWEVPRLLWDNTDIAVTTSGLISTYWSGNDNWITTADDFDATGPWVIERITARGFVSGTSATPTKMSVVIYANDAGKPGAELYRNNAINVASAAEPVIELPTPFTLPGAGKYWISIAGAFDASVSTNAGIGNFRWNIYYGNTPIGLNYHLYDKMALINTVPAVWADASTLIPGSYSMWFKIEGDRGSAAPVYNVFRDGVQIATNITTTSYLDDSGFDPTEGHTWSVATVCGGYPVEPVSVTKRQCSFGDCVMDEAIIGTATTAAYTLPINTYYGYSYTQQIFTADELGFVCDGSALIHEVSFEYVWTTPQGPDGKTNQTFYLGQTSKSSFTGTEWVPVSELQMVYSGTVTYNNAQKWCTIEFDAPFMYTGGNLVLAVLNNHGSYNTSLNATFRYSVPTGGRKTQQYYKDSSPAGPIDPATLTSTSTTTTNRSNTRFGVCEDLFDIDMAVVSLTGELAPVATKPYEYEMLVKNAGKLPASYTVSIVTEGGDVLATETSTTPLSPSDTRIHTFSLTFAQAIAGELEIKGIVEITGDARDCNNETQLILLNIIPHPGYELDCSNSTEITTGTVTTTYTLPANNLYNRSYTQQIYDAAELGIAQGTVINAIAFLPTHTTNNNYLKSNQSVYLANTTKSTFANATDHIPASDLQLVVGTRDITFPHNANPQWFPIEFDQPFVYTGGNIAVVYVNNHGSYQSANTFRMGSAPTGKAITSYTDAVTTLSPTNITGSTATYAYRNHIQFIACEKWYTLNKNNINHCDYAEITLNPTDPVLEGTDAWVTVGINAIGLQNNYWISSLTFGDETIPTPVQTYTRQYPAINDVLPLIEVECGKYYTFNPADTYGAHAVVTLKPSNPVPEGMDAEVTITLDDDCWFINSLTIGNEVIPMESITLPYTIPFPAINAPLPQIVIGTEKYIYSMESLISFIDEDGVVRFDNIPGTISPLGFIGDDMCGKRETFTITPEFGYTVEGIYYNGKKQNLSSAVRQWTTPVIAQNDTVEIRFKDAPYRIDLVYAGEGDGIIEFVENVGTPGEIRTEILKSQPFLYFDDPSAKLFVFTPNPVSSKVEAVYVDGVFNPIATATKSYVFPVLSLYNHELKVVFSLNDMIINASSGPNGTISPAGNVIVSYGKDKLFTLTPSTGYVIDQLFKNNEPVPSSDITYDVVNNRYYYDYKNVIANGTLLVTYKKDTYYIYTTVSGCGASTVAPYNEDGVPVLYHAHQVITFAPAEGCKVVEVLVDGVPDPAAVQTGSKTFYYVTENHTIHVSFAKIQYPVIAKIDGNGTIAPEGTTYVDHGGILRYDFASITGYKIANVFVDGINQPAAVLSGNYTFTNVTAPRSISVVTAIRTFTINASAGVGGYISPAGNITANFGENRTFNFTPATGYEIDEVLINGSPNGSAAMNGSFTFTNIAANHTISVTFKKLRFQMQSIANEKGSIDPSGILDVTFGEDVVYTMIPDEGYRVSQVLVNGINKGAVTNYTFTEVEADGVIEAFFELIPIIGIEDPTMEGVSIYSQLNTVYIVNAKLLPIRDVSIMDMYGRVVWQGNVYNERNEITLDVATGIYNVRVTTNEQVTTTKVSIRR